MSSAGSDACRLLLSLSLSIDSEGVALVFLNLSKTLSRAIGEFSSHKIVLLLCVLDYTTSQTASQRVSHVFRRFSTENAKRGPQQGELPFCTPCCGPLWPSLLPSAENVRSVLCESPRYTVSAVSVAAVRLAIVFAIAAEDARVLQLFCKTLMLLTIRLILDTKASERVVG